jgi:hypothetical protein
MRGIYYIKFMAGLIKNNEMAERLGMSAPAFAKAVRTGRFTAARCDKNGHALFDPDVVIPQYEATADAAKLQNHARMMPEGMRGGRPPKNKNDGSQQLNLFAGRGFQTLESNGGDKGAGTTEQEKFIKVKLTKEASQAKLLAMKVDIQTGKVILKSEVERHGIELGEIMMGIITSWPSRLAQEFEAMGRRGCDGHDYQYRLMEECNNLIIEIRKRCGYGE